MQTKFSRYAPLVAAVVIIFVVAYVQGNWSERWGAHPDLQRFAERIADVPMRAGEWTGRKIEDPGERVRRAAGAEGMFSAIYENGRSIDQEVQVHLVCGRLGDVFYHTPDRCYPASGFSAGGKPVRQTIDLPGGAAEFYTSTFTKQEPSGNQDLRIYWAWCADGPWIAPEREKWTFAGKRALYKLYVVTNASPDQTSEKNPAVDFIRAFVPELQKAFKPAFTESNEMTKKG